MKHCHLFINQTIGPLFDDFIKSIHHTFPDQKIIILTGNPPTLNSDVRVEYVRFTPYDKTNYMTRLRSWFLFTLRVVIFVLRRRNFATVTITTNPPIMSWAIVFVTMLVLKLRIKLLVYDIYPEVITSYYPKFKTSILYKVLVSIDMYVLGKVENLFVISEKMKETYEKRYANKSNLKMPPLSVLPITGVYKNASDRDINKLKNQYHINEDQKVCIYTGNFGRGHDFDTIIESMKYYCDDKIRFLFFGDGYYEEYLQQSAKVLSNLEVHGYLSNDDYSCMLNIADFCFVTLKSDAANFMIPSKVVSYALSGALIISISPQDSDLSALIEKNGIGVNFKNGNTKGLAEYLRTTKKLGGRELRKLRASQIFSSSNMQQIVSKHYE